MRDDMACRIGDHDRTDVKEMVVKVILTREATRAELARDLGIAMPTLSRWVRDAIETAPYGDVLDSLHREVGLLRQENAALQKMLLARNVKDAAPVPGLKRSA